VADVIELKHVDKVYTTGDIKTQVLFDVDLAFEQGSFNSIIGQSGSGKSTLMNIIGTLDRPTKGEVIVDGRTTAKMKKNELARLRNQTIGFVFQFHYLLPEFTACENVLMPYWINDTRPPEKVRLRAEKLLDLVGLSKVKDNPATKMSGGQQQRTAIARSLINNPKIILADEPTGNLDSESSENVYKLFRDINKRLGTTFVIVTHNRRIAEETDRIVEIRDGRIFTDIRR
jgi:lipoprotein-releasing system ATP-binding protein